MDPQDNLYSPEKIKRMLSYFTESSDMGKLYLNYPMVEAFYHMKEIPDIKYLEYSVFMTQIYSFKESVNKLCRDGDYRKFAATKEELIEVIKANLAKAKYISNTDDYNDYKVLTSQCNNLQNNNFLYVLCTCIFYVLDYNAALIDPDAQ